MNSNDFIEISSEFSSVSYPSPFIFKVALGGYSYNYEIEDSLGAFYDYTSAFYGSAGLQLFLGRGNAKGKARVTAEAYITTLGTIGYGMGLIF